MKGFIILFNGHEGTSPIIWLLNNFKKVTSIHTAKGGWEPFDLHQAGHITQEDFAHCFRLIFTGDNRIDFDALNRVYGKTATKAIITSDKSGIAGFKMRPFNFGYLHSTNDTQEKIHSIQRRHLTMLKNLIKECGVNIFFSLRQNPFKRAVSRYHNGMQNKNNHLQFQVIEGLVDPNKLRKFSIDPLIFDVYLRRCLSDVAEKRKLFREFSEEGIAVFPLIYEDFQTDPTQFFLNFFRSMDIEMGINEINEALEAGTPLKKVHGDDIKEYVINYQEIMDKFGHYDLLSLSLEG